MRRWAGAVREVRVRGVGRAVHVDAASVWVRAGFCFYFVLLFPEDSSWRLMAQRFLVGGTRHHRQTSALPIQTLFLFLWHQNFDVMVIWLWATCDLQQFTYQILELKMPTSSALGCCPTEEVWYVIVQ